MTALHASGLGKRYRQRWALSDCSLQIPEGRVAGLVGPNGAGKSTLLNLAVGLLAPDAGTVTIDAPPPGAGAIVVVVADAGSLMLPVPASHVP